MVHVADLLVRAIGAADTVVFGPDGPQGFNTGHLGFMRGFKLTLGSAAGQRVCLIGTGGVGKAVALGQIGLGAGSIAFCDLDAGKAHALADSLHALGRVTPVTIAPHPVDGAHGATGIIICTPLGMSGIGGTPLDKAAMAGATWVFDAVHTSVDTPFLQDAADLGPTIMSGYELFLVQGVDTWTHFTGVPLDAAVLHRAMTGKGA